MMDLCEVRLGIPAIQLPRKVRSTRRETTHARTHTLVQGGCANFTKGCGHEASSAAEIDE